MAPQSIWRQPTRQRHAKQRQNTQASKLRLGQTVTILRAARGSMARPRMHWVVFPSPQSSHHCPAQWLSEEEGSDMEPALTRYLSTKPAPRILASSNPQLHE